MSTITFTKTGPPAWLLAMWKEIDDKTDHPRLLRGAPQPKLCHFITKMFGPSAGQYY